MTIPIAFMAKAESGKTTAANALVARGIPRASFAEPIKTICNPVAEFLYGKNFDKKQARWLYQVVGEAGRAIHKDFWVHKLAESVAEFRYVVIDDLRYINEAEWVRNSNGIVIQIKRTNHENRLSAEERLHGSEVEQDTIVPDLIVTNHYDTAEEFAEHIDKVYTETLLGRWINGR